MEFKYKIPEKFQPLRKEQIWESWDKYEGLEETYHKLGAYEYEQIKDYVPQNPRAVLECGSGLGRGSIYLNHVLGNPKRTIWVLADRDGFSEENTGAFKPKKDEFYNDLALTEEFAILNGMPALRTSTFDTEKEDWEEFNGCFDFIFSFCSLGMHVEIERYIDRLISASSPDVTMIFGTRHAGYNGESFKDKFKEVIYQQGKGQAPFPHENWLILRGLK